MCQDGYRQESVQMHRQRLRFLLQGSEISILRFHAGDRSYC
jgi:hypothetical protein